MPRFFISAGEPSGDLHGSNLAHALRRADPTTTCTGFGGDLMSSAGCDLLYPLLRHAVMGFWSVPAQISSMLRLLKQADNHFREHRPDAVVLIDYPGFHWWLARRRKAQGIPVVWFVPPQLWAWAGWRIHKMRRLADHILCSLPFEPAWYKARGVSAHFLGHPYFDELNNQQLSAAFVEDQQERGGTVIGLLPGSRDQEVELNLPTLVGAAQRLHRTHPDARFLVAAYRPAHRDRILAAWPNDVPAEVCVGRTAEVIHLARVCVAVSGSVGLELLYRTRPSVILYRTTPLMLAIGRSLVSVRYGSLVNILADHELFPEFVSCRPKPDGVAARVAHWLDDEDAYNAVQEELAQLRQRVAQPGGCARAAAYLLAAVARPINSERRAS